MWAFIEKATKKILVIGEGALPPPSNFDLSRGTTIEIPEQDVSDFYDRAEGMPPTLRECYFPGTLIQFTAEEKAQRVDAETDRKIGAALHPAAPIGEQMGRLRAEIVNMMNALNAHGIPYEPTPEFAAFNVIALVEIATGQAKKGALDA